MVSPSTVLGDLNNINKEFTNYYRVIGDMSDSVWQGSSKNNLVSRSEEFIGEYKSPINSQMSAFSSAISLYEEYKEAKEKVENAKISLQAAIADEDEAAISSLNAVIRENEALMEKLKQEILQLLQQISSLQLESATKIVGSINTFDVDSLVSQYDDGSLKKLGEKETLASYYDEGYIQEKMAAIKNSSVLTGREKAVNSALTLIQLAADKGVKLDYDFGGAHDGTVVTTDDVLKGVDCSTFASFIINQGTTKDVTSMTTWALENKYVKYSTDYENAKPGDLLNYNSGSKGHVEIIIENHPEEGYFITAEARGSDYGIELNKTTYSDCRKVNQEVYNMDDVYDK